MNTEAIGLVGKREDTVLTKSVAAMQPLQQSFGEFCIPFSGYMALQL